MSKYPTDITTRDKKFPPAPRKRLKDFYKAIIQRSALNKPCTLVGVPKVGKIAILSYTLRNRFNIGKKSELDDRIWPWIDIGTLISNEDNGRSELLRSLDGEVSKFMPNLEMAIKQKGQKFSDFDWSDVFDIFHKITWEEEVSISLVVNNFQELYSLDEERRKHIVDTIYKIKSDNPMKVTFIFLNDGEWNNEELVSVGRLQTYFVDNIYWFKFFDNEWSEYAIDILAETSEMKLTKKMNNRIAELTGGYPSLMKNIIENISVDESMSKKFMGDDIGKLYDLLGKENLDTRFSLITQYLFRESRMWLVGREGEPTDFLLESGLVEKSDDGSYKCFSELFERYVERNRNSLVEQKSVVRVVDTQQLKKVLSGQELILFKTLAAVDGEMVSKEDLAQTVWGGDWADKYSAWALDKMISRLRKKLSDAGFGKEIRVVRNRGVMLS